MIRMFPKHPRTGLIVLVVAAAAAWFAAGCARKATETPPTPAEPPAQSTAPSTPPPTPAPPEPAPTGGDTAPSGFEPVFFDYDSATLRDDARTALDHNARLLREQGDSKVTIEGHCDERGTIEYNQALGERRAQAAMEYLTAAGISGSRLDVVSYGKERPFDMGHDERAWAANRRAHFAAR